MTISDEDFIYEVIDGTINDLKITSKNTFKSSYVIPTYVYGDGGLQYTVKEISNFLFNGMTSLTSISFQQPSYITKIGNRAFDGCINLNVNLSITELFPSTIESVGEYAFRECRKLNGTLNLSNHQYLNNVGKGAFINCVLITGVLLPDNFSFFQINEETFNGCFRIQNELVIPNNILTIGKKAFYGCFNIMAPLNILTIPSSVSSVGDYAFYNSEYQIGNDNNKTIATISINSSNITLGLQCFYGYEQLDTVTFKDYNYYSETNDIISPFFISNKTITYTFNGLIPGDGDNEPPANTLNTTLAIDWITQNNNDSNNYYETWNDSTKDNSNPVTVIDYSENLITCFMSTDPAIYPIAPKVKIIKLNKNGTVLWSNLNFSNNDNKIAYVVPSIDVDIDNNVYVSYFFQNRNTPTQEKIVITKLNGQTGLIISTFYELVDSNLYSPYIKIDSDKNVYLAYTKNSSNINLHKISSSGVLDWSKNTINATDSYSSPMLTIDDTNNIYLGFSELTESTSNDIVIIKYSSAGSVLWTLNNQTINTSNTDLSCKIHLKGDFLYLTYVTLGTLTGTGNEHDGNVWTGDIVVVKLNKSDGTKVWGKQSLSFNTPVEDSNPSITVDNSDNLYIAYNTNSSVNLLENTNNKFSQDVVIFKLDFAGVLRCLTQSTAWNNSLISGATSDVYTSQELNPTIMVDSTNKLYVSYSSNYSTQSVNKGNVKLMKLNQTITVDPEEPPPFEPPSDSPLDLLSDKITDTQYIEIYDNIRVINSTDSIIEMPIFSEIKDQVADITDPDELENVTQTINATANLYTLLNLTELLTYTFNQINTTYPPGEDGVPSWPDGTAEKFKTAYNKIKELLDKINEQNTQINVYSNKSTNTNSISKTREFFVDDNVVADFQFTKDKIRNNPSVKAELPAAIYETVSTELLNSFDNIFQNEFVPFTDVSPFRIQRAVKNAFETYSDNVYDTNNFAKYNGTRWISIVDKPLPVLTYFGTIVTYNNSLYVIGGLSTLRSNKFNEPYRSPMYFGQATPLMKEVKYIMNDKVKNKESKQLIHSRMRLFNKTRWSSAAGPSIKRYRSSAIVFNNKIYLIGGHTSYDPIHEYNEQPTTDRVETYNGVSWTLLPTSNKLNFSRAACASVVYKNTIYVIGGYDDKYYGVRDIETLNTQTNTWSVINYEYDSNSQNDFYGYSCCAAVYSNSIYILDVNGVIFKLTKNSDNTHTLTDDTPQPLIPVSNGGVNSKLLTHNGKLFLIGGDEDINSTQFQVFNGNVWTTFNTRLPFDSSFALEAVVL